MMWWPVVVIPTMAPAGVAAVFSRRAAKTVLPVASAVVVANGLQGTFLHWRGIVQKPGGVQSSLQHRDGTAHVRPAAGLHGGRHGASWPRCCAAKGTGERPDLSAASASAGDARRVRADSAISTCSVRSSRWDLVTAGVVLARLDTDPQLSFFTPAEEPTVRALVDLLLAQHDEPRVPVVELVDQRLTAGRDRRLALRRHARRRRRVAANAWPHSTRTRTSSTATLSPR